MKKIVLFCLILSVTMSSFAQVQKGSFSLNPSFDKSTVKNGDISYQHEPSLALFLGKHIRIRAEQGNIKEINSLIRRKSIFNFDGDLLLGTSSEVVPYLSVGIQNGFIDNQFFDFNQPFINRESYFTAKIGGGILCYINPNLIAEANLSEYYNFDLEKFSAFNIRINPVFRTYPKEIIENYIYEGKMNFDINLKVNDRSSFFRFSAYRLKAKFNYFLNKNLYYGMEVNLINDAENITNSALVNCGTYSKISKKNYFTFQFANGLGIANDASRIKNEGFLVNGRIGFEHFFNRSISFSTLFGYNYLYNGEDWTRNRHIQTGMIFYLN